MSDQPTEQLAAMEPESGRHRSALIDDVMTASTPNTAPAPPRPRLHMPMSAVAVLGVGLVAMVLLALFAWHGVFAPHQLALVLLGALFFTAAGLVTLWRARTLLGAALGWAVAGALLVLPFLAGTIATGHGSRLNLLVVSAVALWVSGVAVAALITAVACLVLHSRTYR